MSTINRCLCVSQYCIHYVWGSPSRIKGLFQLADPMAGRFEGFIWCCKSFRPLYREIYIFSVDLMFTSSAHRPLSTAAPPFICFTFNCFCCISIEWQNHINDSHICSQVPRNENETNMQIIIHWNLCRCQHKNRPIPDGINGGEPPRVAFSFGKPRPEWSLEAEMKLEGPKWRSKAKVKLGGQSEASFCVSVSLWVKWRLLHNDYYRFQL